MCVCVCVSASCVSAGYGRVVGLGFGPAPSPTALALEILSKFDFYAGQPRATVAKMRFDALSAILELFDDSPEVRLAAQRAACESLKSLGVAIAPEGHGCDCTSQSACRQLVAVVY